jgi:hypothetical protein
MVLLFHFGVGTTIPCRSAEMDVERDARKAATEAGRQLSQAELDDLAAQQFVFVIDDVQGT